MSLSMFISLLFAYFAILIIKLVSYISLCVLIVSGVSLVLLGLSYCTSVHNKVAIRIRLTLFFVCFVCCAVRSTS